jgi:tRNA pseudouridine55 synthase
MAINNIMDINGWINIYKPCGYTSANVVAIVKKLLTPFGVKKVGHGGTLDPLAFGTLPICINKATKTASYIMDFKKIYNFYLTFGEERTTDDSEGEVVNRSNKIPSINEINAILPQFTGRIQQTPPSYSAIRVQGKRAYDLARKGVKFELKPREVEVLKLECKGFIDKSIADDITKTINQNNTVEFEVKCGKGFYIRSLGKDLARALGSFGYISKLERTEVGIFTKTNSITLQELEKFTEKKEINKLLIQIKL